MSFLTPEIAVVFMIAVLLYAIIKFKVNPFDFFKETGDLSSTRLNGFLCLLLAAWYLYYQTVNEKQVEWEIIVALLGYAGATKVLQKREEVKQQIQEQANGTATAG